MREYGSTTPKGRYAEYPQITAFDLDRPLRDVIAEVADNTGWTFDRSKDNMNFGIRNCRQGEFARANDLSAGKALERLRAEVVDLCTRDQGADAMSLSKAIRNAKSDDAIVSLAQELWPPDETPADFERTIGAEAQE